MGQPLFTVNTTIAWDPAVKARQIAEEMKLVLETVAMDWKFGTMPHHFQLFAMAKYGYVPRKLEYLKRKLRKWGHQRPLVWSGRLLRKALTSTTRAAKSQGQVRVALTFHGGFYLRRRELFSTTGAERKRMARYVRAGFVAFAGRRCPPKPLGQMGS